MTGPEDERSLQKRPDNLPENLLRGGLIVGSEPNIQGSLMNVAGTAIERITRERSEVPPQFRLPERPVYFLDPNTRRLISISNRENVQPFKSGLFAEIVELDDKGEPKYTLSTSKLILPDGNYQLVAIAPNSFGLPPSHIPIIEEEEGKATKKQEFVPWNLYLSQLQDWMDKVTINPGEDFQSFIDRFRFLRKDGQKKVTETIQNAFPGGEQGFDENMLPINLIITDKGQDSFLARASLRAGLYPAVITPGDFANMPRSTEDWFKFDFKGPSAQILDNILRSRDVGVAFITKESDAISSYLKSYSGENHKYALHVDPFNFQINNPVFAIINIFNTKSAEREEKLKRHGLNTTPYAEKAKNGWYVCSPDEDTYNGLLNKLKADLLLTMFLRGGAPMVK